MPDLPEPEPLAQDTAYAGRTATALRPQSRSCHSQSLRDDVAAGAGVFAALAA